MAPNIGVDPAFFIQLLLISFWFALSIASLTAPDSRLARKLPPDVAERHDYELGPAPRHGGQNHGGRNPRTFRFASAASKSSKHSALTPTQFLGSKLLMGKQAPLVLQSIYR
jgi:hypothetical protein